MSWYLGDLGATLSNNLFELLLNASSLHPSDSRFSEEQKKRRHQLQRRGERRATINEELWGGVYVRERFISQSEHTPKYVY